MITKKLGLMIGAFAFVFMTAGTASAAWSVNDGSSLDVMRSHFISITSSNSNSASISNNVQSNSTSGGNVISAQEDVEDASITSGDAESYAQVENVANEIDSQISVDVSGCGCAGGSSDDIDVDDDSDVTIDESHEATLDYSSSNDVSVNNSLSTRAHTGDNMISSEDDDVEGGTIHSGMSSTGSSLANAFNILRSRIMWSN